jgi:hypothetical protein
MPFIFVSEYKPGLLPQKAVSSLNLQSIDQKTLLAVTNTAATLYYTIIEKVKVL